MPRVEWFSSWLRNRADTRAGVVGMFGWAFAEALVWPIIPDASLALLVASRPRRWLALAGAAVAGTVTGGVTGLLAAAQGATWPLWLTTPRMAAAADGWLRAGAEGLSHQPLSGVPYKVFVSAAADAGIGVLPFALATLQYRAPRLIVVAAVVAAASAVAWRIVPQRHQAAVHVAVSAGGTVLLLAGLALVVRSWS